MISLVSMSLSFDNGVWLAFDFKGIPVFKNDTLRTQETHFGRKMVMHLLLNHISQVIFLLIL
jgi:hypothetical protein